MRDVLTRPVTGLSFASDEAYETDWGISMDATVRPPRISPPRLAHTFSISSENGIPVNWNTYRDHE